MVLWEMLNAKPCNREVEQRSSNNFAGGVKRLPFDRRCAARTKAGRRCRGRIRKESDFCFFHDPTVSELQRRRDASKGGRSNKRQLQVPGGYLRGLTSTRAAGNAMDRLYREIRSGVVTPEMGQILFQILTRVMESNFGGCKSEAPLSPRTKAARLRPQVAAALTQAERRAWRRAVAKAPDSLWNPSNRSGRPGVDQSNERELRRVALPAAS